ELRKTSGSDDGLRTNPFPRLDALQDGHRIGVSMSAALKAFTLGAVLMTGCSIAHINAAGQRMVEAQNEGAIAQNPEAKAYWQGIYDCHSKGIPWPTNMAEGEKGST